MFKFRNSQTLAVKLAIGLGLILSASLASASVILNFDNTSTSSNSPATGASATAELSFSDDSGGGVLINFGIKNTTGENLFGSGATTSKLTGVAVDLFTPSTVSDFVGGANLDTLIVSAAAQPFGTIDIAIADNANFNGGNANDALAEGQTDSASLILSGTGLTAVGLEAAFLAGLTEFATTGTTGFHFVARFQQVNAGSGSDKLEGGTVTSTAVPEPATLALLGLGLLGFSVARRRS